MTETIDVTPTNNSVTQGNTSSRDVSGSMTISHVLYALHASSRFTMPMIIATMASVQRVKGANACNA